LRIDTDDVTAIKNLTGYAELEYKHRFSKSALIYLVRLTILGYYMRNNIIRLTTMLKVKITPIGNSMGIVLPKEALTKLKAGKGDVLYLIDGPEGLTLTPYQQDFENQLEAAEKVMKKYRNALHELAK